jgi:molybdenum cofactor synthesis domain-containing protein
MRPFTSTLPFADAFTMMMGAAVPIARTETIDLVDADGRVVAADVIAAVDVPPFDRAAMDGYAVIAADTTGAAPQSPATLTCAGRLFTGQVASHSIALGTCLEIATGAPIPAGADAVVIVEDTTRDGDVVRIRGPVRPGQNIGRRAADIAAGAVTARAGQVLTPSRIGALAAAGAAAVDVYARPSVAILSTGDELVEPGVPLAPGQIYDVNRYTLETVVQRHGGVASARPISVDSLDELIAALDEAAAHDVVVFSGGSSVGDRDLLRDALAARGEIHFHGIAVKPGKPTAFATVAGTPVFAMPGYPTSCLSNAYMLLVPFLRAVARLPPWQPRTIDAPLARRISSAPGRLQFYTVRIVDGRAEPAFKASGDITSMADADGYIEIPAATDAVEAGTMVTVKLF